MSFPVESVQLFKSDQYRYDSPIMIFFLPFFDKNLLNEDKFF